MSQITVLGFTPSRLASSSDGANAIHWAILLTPTASTSQNTPATARPKAKSFFSAQRRLSKDDSNTTSSPETILFDMHNHQLRQQQFPVSVESSEPSETPRTTTSISSDIPNKPFTLSLRILLSTDSLPVSKLAQKLSPLLYHTPTYGPEEDWLRAALDMFVGSGILEPAVSYDADAVLAFAGEAVREYLDKIDQARQSQHEVLELDYAKHIREMDAVRAMFSRDLPAAPSHNLANTQSPGSQPARSSSHHYFTLHNNSRPKSNATDVLIKTHKFLGFRVSPSPTAYSARQRWASGGEKRAYFERQDDPYGGLM